MRTSDTLSNQISDKIHLFTGPRCSSLPNFSFYQRLIMLSINRNIHIQILLMIEELQLLYKVFKQYKKLTSEFILQQQFEMYEQYLYKQELLNTFGKDDQLVDNVKLQLRQKIINKLKNNKPANVPATEASLMRKLSNSLIAQHLESQRLFHSLAVFAPEAGFNKHHFSDAELQSMLSLSRTEDQSLLESLLAQAMPRGRMLERRTESAVQTDDQQSITNLQNRLGEVEFNFKQKMMAGLKGVEDSEARFLKYKTELNRRYREELDQEITRIRNFQLANIRMEEQERSKLRMKQLEQQLEGNYRAKMEKLREREAEVIQRVTAKMKDVETYNFQARQRVLKDYETLKAREEQLDRLKDQLLQKERQLISRQ